MMYIAYTDNGTNPIAHGSTAGHAKRRAIEAIRSEVIPAMFSSELDIQVHRAVDYASPTFGNGSIQNIQDLVSCWYGWARRNQELTYSEAKKAAEQHLAETVDHEWTQELDGGRFPYITSDEAVRIFKLYALHQEGS